MSKKSTISSSKRNKGSQPAVSGVDYRERLRALRVYYDGWDSRDGYRLDRALTPAQKGAITRKYNEHSRFMSFVAKAPGDRAIPMRTRDPLLRDKLRQELGSFDYAYPRGFKGNLVFARVPAHVDAVSVDRRGSVVMLTSGGEGGRLIRTAIEPDGIRSVFESFDPAWMLANPVAAAEGMLRLHPDASAIAIRAGETGWVRNQSERLAGTEYTAVIGDIPGRIKGMKKREYEAFRHATRVEMIANMIRALGVLYGADTRDMEDEDYETGIAIVGNRPVTDKYGELIDVRKRAKKSHYIRKWLTGLVAHYLPQPREYGEFLEYARQVRNEKRKVSRKRTAQRKGKANSGKSRKR